MHMFIEIGKIKIPGYGLFIAIGLLAVMLYLRLQKYYKGLDFDTSLSAMLYALIIGAIGAKILYWITDPDSFMWIFNGDGPLLKRIQDSLSGGLVFLGGLIGAAIGIFIFLSKNKNIKLLPLLDIFAVGMPILQMFGRVGCFMAGCCYGACTDSEFSVVFPEGGLAPAHVHLYPTQLMGVVGNAIIVITLLLVQRKNKKPGKVFGLYLIMYSIGRFILEFFRGDEIRGIYGPLSTSQWISIPLLIVGIIVFIRAGRKEYEEDIVNI